MRVGDLHAQLCVEGIMPERALLRLKRAGICLEKVKKVEKNRLLFCVKKKDVEKVFAIYPKVCYNRADYTPYRVRYLGGAGFAKWVEFLQNRAGVVLGILLFCILTLSANRMVLGVELVGNTSFQRETVQALAECGISLFAPYKEGKEELVTAKLLALPNVEFCSVQKIGNRIRVEIRRSGVAPLPRTDEAWKATREGKLVALSVLQGTPLKGVGEEVKEGETLVGNYFSVDGEHFVKTQPIARARLSCVYEAVHAAASQEEAFAQAYLVLNLSEKDEILQTEVRPVEGGFHVKIHYCVTVAVNLTA